MGFTAFSFLVNVRCKSCPNVKILALLCLGRHFAHFELPAMAYYAQNEFPLLFVLFCLFPTFGQKEKVKANSYLNFLHSLSFYMIFRVVKQLHHCLISSFEQIYLVFCCKKKGFTFYKMLQHFRGKGTAAPSICSPPPENATGCLRKHFY